MKLFVGNFSFSTTEEDLRTLFQPFGNIESISVVTDRQTGRSRGFGFVEMNDSGEAGKAIEALNGKEFGGRTLNVNEARPKVDSGGGCGGRGGGGRGGGGGGGPGACSGHWRRPPKNAGGANPFS